MNRFSTAATLTAAFLFAGCNLTYDRDGLEFDSPSTSKDAEPNDTTATALPLMLGTDAVGTIGSDTDFDYWVFTVPAGGLDARFQTLDTSGSGCSGMDTQIAIHDADGNLQASSDDSSIAYSYCEDLGYQLAAGTYYLTVSEASSTFSPPFNYLIRTTTGPFGGTVNTVRCEHSSGWCDEVTGTFTFDALLSFQSFCSWETYGVGACPASTLSGYCDAPASWDSTYGTGSTFDWVYYAPGYSQAQAMESCSTYGGSWVGSATCDPQATCNLYGDGDYCADLSSDPLNCNGCGQPCAPGATCAANSCVGGDCVNPYSVCYTGLQNGCFDLQNDPANCGSCGNACGVGTLGTCSGGYCDLACGVATPNHCGSGATQYCADFLNDPANCNACGTACTTCAAGVCDGGIWMTVSCTDSVYGQCVQITGTMTAADRANTQANCSGTYLEAGCDATGTVPNYCDLGSLGGDTTGVLYYYYGASWDSSSAPGDCETNLGGLWNGPVGVTLGAVEPLLGPAAPAGVFWNDRVAGASWSEALLQAKACEPAMGDACIHGGELRRFRVTGKSACTPDLTATDGYVAGGAFDWVCTEGIVPGEAWFVSTGLRPGARLADLVDAASPAWRTGRVTVNDQLGFYGTTPAAAWWGNSVLPLPTDGNLNVPSAVYVQAAGVDPNVVISAPRVALVIPRGQVLAPTDFSREAVRAVGVDNVWVEGDVDMAYGGHGVRLDTSYHSVLRDLFVTRPSDANGFIGIHVIASQFTRSERIAAWGFGNGVLANEGGFNRYDGVDARDCAFAGLSVSNTVSSDFRNVTVRQGPGSATGVSLNASGVEINGSSQCTLTGLEIEGQGIGLRFFNGAAFNKVSGVASVANLNYGVYVDGASDNAIVGIRAGNNGASGIYLATAHRNVLADVLSVSNGSDGLFVSFSNDNRILGVTSSRNAAWGVWLSDSVGNVVASVAAFQNMGGIRFTRSTGTLLGDAAFTDHTNTGLYSDGAAGNPSSTRVAGYIRHDGKPWTCDADSFSSGFGAGCTWTTPSVPAEIFVLSDVSLATAAPPIFMGYVPEDLVNASDSAGAAMVVALDDPTFDWFGFDTLHRAWTAGSAVIGTFRLGCGDPSQRFSPICATGWTGAAAVFDWSLRPDANRVLHAPLEQPQAVPFVVHTWSMLPVPSEFFAHAFEVLGDGLGNDDGLCDRIGVEECIYTPNIGAYQGHGGYGYYDFGTHRFYTPALNGNPP